MNKILGSSLLTLCLMVGALTGAHAQERAVQLGGGYGLLYQPRHARGSLVIMPGGDGRVGITADGKIASEANTIVRVRHVWQRAGFATLVVDAGADSGAAVAYMRNVARPVTVIAMSRAGTRVGPAIAARPNGLVLVSAMLDGVENATSPAGLPPTLVIENRLDECRLTLPSQVDPFVAWSGGRARVKWLSGGSPAGRKCGTYHYHGFHGIEGRMAAAVAGFARSVR